MFHKTPASLDPSSWLDMAISHVDQRLPHLSRAPMSSLPVLKRHDVAPSSNLTVLDLHVTSLPRLPILVVCKEKVMD